MQSSYSYALDINMCICILHEDIKLAVGEGGQLYKVQ